MLSLLLPILCVVASLVCAAKAVASLPRLDADSDSGVAPAHGERSCHALAPFVVGERCVRSLAD